MILTIHTYGHIDSMYYILNSIAMIMNSQFADIMIQSLAFVATCYYGFKTAYASASGGHKQNLAKLAAMVVVINSLLIPKTTIFIEDHVTKQRDKVDNLPYGFAVPVGFMEQFGDILTAAFEQAFASVGSSNYRDYGMVFGARLVQEARNWRIKTPEFVHNMDHFISRCVVMDASIGHKYTINDLFQTDDVWGLVSSNASDLRRVDIRVGNSNELLTCKEAIDTVLAPSFITEIDILKAKYLKTEFGLAGSTGGILTPRGVFSPNNLFKKNLETIFGAYLGSSNSAEGNMRQFMMLNSMSDYSRTYGYARSSMTQDTNWQISGDLASTYLPILLSVIKGLVYASFIFMVPLMILGGGGSKYIHYIAFVASLQLWPSLNAVLNMFIDIYSASQMQDIANGAISFTSYSRLGNYADKIVAVSSGLQMMIPFLAFNIVHGGVGGFIHLAGNITSASTAASSSSAHEIATGNKSFDNYSSGNMQMAMQQGFKTDFNQSYRSGSMELQLDDGVIERITPGGKMLLQSGIGMTASGGSVKFNLRDSETAQISDNISSAKNILENNQKLYHESASATFSKGSSWLAQVASRAHNDKSFTYEELGDQAHSTHKAVNLTYSLMSQHHYNYEKAAQMALKIGAGFSSILGSSIGGDVSISATNNSHQSMGNHNQSSTEQFTREDYTNVIKASMNEQYSESKGIDKIYSADIRRSYDIQQRAEEAFYVQAEKIDSLSRVLSKVQSNDASYDREMYDEVQQEAADRYSKGDLRAAHHMIETHDPRISNIWNNIVTREVDSLIKYEMNEKQIGFTDHNIAKKLNSADQNNIARIETDYTKDIKSLSAQDGINPEDPQFLQNTIEEKMEDLAIDNRITFKAARKENRQIEVAKQQGMDGTKDK